MGMLQAPSPGTQPEASSPSSTLVNNTDQPQEDEGPPSHHELCANPAENTRSTALAVCQASQEDGGAGAPPDLQDPASQGDRHHGGLPGKQQGPGCRELGQDLEATNSQGRGSSRGQPEQEHVRQELAEALQLRGASEAAEAPEPPLSGRGARAGTRQGTTSGRACATGSPAGPAENFSAHGADAVPLRNGVAVEQQLQGCAEAPPLGGGEPAAVRQVRGTLETLPEEAVQSLAPPDAAHMRQTASRLPLEQRTMQSPGAVRESTGHVHSVQAGGPMAEPVAVPLAQTNPVRSDVAGARTGNLGDAVQRDRRITRAWKHSQAAAAPEVGAEAALGTIAEHSCGKPEGAPKGPGRRRRGSKRKAASRGGAGGPQEEQENCAALANVAAEGAGPRQADCFLSASLLLPPAFLLKCPHLPGCALGCSLRLYVRTRTHAAIHPSLSPKEKLSCVLVCCPTRFASACSCAHACMSVRHRHVHGRGRSRLGQWGGGAPMACVCLLQGELGLLSWGSVQAPESQAEAVGWDAPEQRPAGGTGSRQPLLGRGDLHCSRKLAPHHPSPHPGTHAAQVVLIACSPQYNEAVSDWCFDRVPPELSHDKDRSYQSSH